MTDFCTSIGAKFRQWYTSPLSRRAMNTRYRDVNRILKEAEKEKEANDA